VRRTFPSAYLTSREGPASQQRSRHQSGGRYPISKGHSYVGRGQQGHRWPLVYRFWGPNYNPDVIDEIAAPDIRFEYSLHAPLRGRDAIRDFATKFRAAFPDLAFAGTADLIAEGDYVVGQWIGGGTHTGDPMTDLPLGGLPEANTDKSMRFTGTTVLKVENGLITEEIGLDDGVSVLQQLGLIATS
jgi:predicted ester cyclase